MNWLISVFLSALFAALTAILAKIGLAGCFSSDFFKRENDLASCFGSDLNVFGGGNNCPG